MSHEYEITADEDGWFILCRLENGETYDMCRGAYHSYYRHNTYEAAKAELEQWQREEADAYKEQNKL